VPRIWQRCARISKPWSHSRQALADPFTKAAYAARACELNIPVYALIFLDRRRGRRVEAINLGDYTGKAGQEIQIRVDDASTG
jgi:hypothetical protein